MTIETFDTTLIERYLHARHMHYYRDRDGDFLVMIATDDGPELRVHLTAEGSDRRVFVIRVTTLGVYPAHQRAQLESLIGQWNREKRWPKAYLSDVPDHGGIRVFGENAYPLMSGIHWDLFATLADYTIGAAADLLIWLTQAVGLPTAHEMESWLRRRGDSSPAVYPHGVRAVTAGAP